MTSSTLPLSENEKVSGLISWSSDTFVLPQDVF